MPRKLDFDSYLDADGDFFVWMSDREGYRFYPKENWPETQMGVDGFIDHIARKSLENRVDIARLRKLAEISLLKKTEGEVGLEYEGAFAALTDLGHGDYQD